MSIRSGAIVLVIVLAALYPARVSAEWWLWESPTDNTEVIDQEQELFPIYIYMQPGSGIGQQFTTGEDVADLYRMDFMITNRDDMRPFTVKLWKWNDTYETTIQGTVLFEDVISVPGPSERVLVTVFPRIEVEPETMYFFEFNNSTADGEWGIYGVWENNYPDGLLHFKWPRPGGDLFFRTYSNPQGDPSPPAFASSAPAPWTDPSPPGAAITAQDYADIVQGKADSGRDNAKTVPGAHSHEFAMFDAFLYRKTADEWYADNVVQMLMRAKEWWYANPSCNFTWMEYAGWAYLWVEQVLNDPLNDYDEEREAIKNLLLDYAESLWSSRELGVFNRSLGGCLTYKLVTDLFPNEPDAQTYAEWKSYADGVWNDFKTHWDFMEESTSYNCLSWRYVLELAMLYGEDDTIWSEPGFRDLVKRFYHYYSALGTASISGDMLGIHQSWGLPSWLFDKAASKWNATEYKWLAWRTFDYQRQHIKGFDQEFWKAVYNEYPAFCHAYFDTDEGISNTQPAAQREVLEASQDSVDQASWLTDRDGTGQTFRPTATPLIRIDVKAQNDGKTKPATLKLWKWAVDYQSTVSQVPLYQGAVDLSAAGTFQVVSVFPFLDVEVGVEYYVELSRNQRFYLAGSDAEVYPDGHIWQDEVSKYPKDLWFRTHTLSDDGSVYTTRLEVFPRRVSQVGDPAQYGDFGTAQISDKLILRSGYDIDGLHAVINLIAGDYGHGHMETGAITALVDDGAILFADSSYYDRQSQEHNEPITKRYWGGTYVAPATSTTVSRFVDYRRATVAWLDWPDIYGWNLTQQRRFYFVKDRFILVRDRTVFGEPMHAATGNVWHAYDVQADHAPNWYSLYDREPLGLNIWRFKNPERYVLLYMLDRDGYDTVEWKETYAGNPPSPPFVMYQRWVGDTAGEPEKWFDTVLLPHGDDLTPTLAAANISVPYDDGVNIAFKVKVGNETWTLVDNPEGVTINASGVHTDATYMIARTQQGMAGYLLAHEATVAEVVDGSQEISRTWPVRTSVEIGGY
jgi:hypothetical protein